MPQILALWERANYGRDVIIGVIDTGINQFVRRETVSLNIGSGRGCLFAVHGTAGEANNKQIRKLKQLMNRTDEIS